jgi:acyl-homoserine-lactone acylase
MMRAQTLAEWKEAMRVRAMPSSNFTYADADGHILLVWNARLPAFPHAPAPDRALPAAGTDDIWTELVAWDELPRHEDPAGGYVQNSNDTPHFDNGLEILDHADLPPGTPEPRLRLRSQLSLRLAEEMGDDLTLDGVIAAKHDLTMLAAERLKDDLVGAARSDAAEAWLATGRAGAIDIADLQRAADLLAAWDNRASVDARGAVLFDRWLRAYTAAVPDSLEWTEPWSIARPRTTPRGLGDPESGVRALTVAMAEANARWGGWDVAWGDVHRARLGDVDLPAPGCSNLAGCFRILEYRTGDDDLLEVRRGDGWISAVEFTDPLQARSILAYGQTNDPTSPHHTDQLQRFLDGDFKRVVFDWAEIEAAAVRRYRPGR